MNNSDEKLKWLKCLEDLDRKSMIKQASQSTGSMPIDWTSIGNPQGKPWSAGSPVFLGKQYPGHFPSGGGMPWDQILKKQVLEKQKQASPEVEIEHWIRSQPGTGRASLDKRAAELAAACEQAQGALGARHQLRIALSEGNEQAWLRCWGVVMERGFGSKCLEQCKSETLASAALGKNPFKALEWLSGAGFDPGVALSSQILLACLASGSTGSGAAQALVELFKAGSLNAAVRSTLDAIKKGLGGEAFANGESFELAGFSGKGKPKKDSSRL